MKKEKDLNLSCPCQTLDPEKLLEFLGQDIFTDIQSKRPHLFSTTSVYISENNFNEMKMIIEAIEKVIHQDSFKNFILKNSPVVAKKDTGPWGVFMGYDFHLSQHGLKLIEINTNAGGALLNTYLTLSQKKCCNTFPFKKDLEDIIFKMFIDEWETRNKDRKLKTVAIVDENPKEQYLYPEFLLFKKLFESRGLECLILDSGELTLCNGRLYYESRPIDLVYNRLTDFYFEKVNSQNLRLAFSNEQVVVTPNPHHHALYANKINLEYLSSRKDLEGFNIPQEIIDILIKGIPKSEIVKEPRLNDFWENRKNLFFKPAQGFGSKASYRGDKITKKIWNEINHQIYIAQEYAPPGQRIVKVDENDYMLKVDLRAYVYRSEIQLLAARMYMGQTTNFRTKGGGFAPVFVTHE